MAVIGDRLYIRNPEREKYKPREITDEMLQTFEMLHGLDDFRRKPNRILRFKVMKKLSNTIFTKNKNHFEELNAAMANLHNKLCFEQEYFFEANKAILQLPLEDLLKYFM